MRQSPPTEILRELTPDEQLLWSGRPPVGLRLQPSDVFHIPFSLLWCGFVVVWEYSALRNGAPAFFALFGVPFVLVGLHILIGRFIADALARKHTVYGVTSNRIILVSGVFTRRTKSLNLRSLSDISLNERRSGGGTIQLGPQHPMFSRMPAGWPGTEAMLPPNIEVSDGARDVYDTIIRAQRESR